MSATTYRGVRVPDHLRRDRAENGPYAATFNAWREGVDSAMDVMRPMVEDLHDDSPCRLDHDGCCQSHGLPTPHCPDGQARRLLKRTEAD